MNADSLTARDLFEKQVRYVIPTFQRPYVWTKDDQWEPFWEDVQHAADRYLEELDLDDPHASRAEAQGRAGRHFLGAIVVKQIPNAAGEVETREVIDGQQRLTTMQLLLDAAEQVAREEDWDDISEDLRDLVLNKKRYAKKDPDLVFKLWPTTADQEAFRAVMDDARSEKEFGATKVAQAHQYFRLRVRDWVSIGLDEASRLHRIEALRTALVGLLEIVVIDLGTSDDAFVIFETLNARGTPLLASDLVKNYLLQTAEKAGHSTDTVNASFWRQFDNDWWRKEIRQGRLRRPRIDTFLDYWLEMRDGTEVASHEIFPKFKDAVEADPAGVLELAQSMRTTAAVFRDIEELNRFSRDGTFLYRWETLDARVLTPLLLWAFSFGRDVLPPHRRTRLLEALESYLVRRLVNRMTTKMYNRLFLDALKELIEAGPAQADEVLIGFLARQTADSTIWPNDSTFRKAFLDLPAYRLVTRGRVRMVLEALEDDHRGAKSEDQFVTRNKLTVEHIMPQSWQPKWPLPSDVDSLRAELDRDRLVHTLGNLTLATSSLNATLSNHGWEEKLRHLENNSVLFLNKEILSQAREAGGWHEEAITTRGTHLFERALGIWPRPM